MTFDDHILALCPICTANVPRRYSGGQYYLTFVRHAQAMGWITTRDGDAK